MNIIEFANEYFVMMSAYCLPLFTEYVGDIGTRYLIGDYFMFMVIALVIFNCSVIVVQACITLVNYAIYLHVKMDKFRDKKQGKAERTTAEYKGLIQFKSKYGLKRTMALVKYSIKQGYFKKNKKSEIVSGESSSSYSESSS